MNLSRSTLVVACLALFALSMGAWAVGCLSTSGNPDEFRRTSQEDPVASGSRTHDTNPASRSDHSTGRPDSEAMAAGSTAASDSDKPKDPVADSPRESTTQTTDDEFFDVQVICENDGVPVAAATVSTADNVKLAVTDAAGHARLDALKIGPDLIASAEGFVPRHIAIRRSTRTTVIGLLRLAGEGRVVTKDGVPVEARIVMDWAPGSAADDWLGRKGAMSAEGWSCTTNADGTFRYPIRPMAQSCAAFSSGGWQGRSTLGAHEGSVVIVVGSGATLRFQFEPDARPAGCLLLFDSPTARLPLHRIAVQTPFVDLQGVPPNESFTLRADFLPGLEWEVLSPNAGMTRVIPIFGLSKSLEVRVVTSDGHAIADFAELAVQASDGPIVGFAKRSGMDTVAWPLAMFPSPVSQSIPSFVLLSESRVVLARGTGADLSFSGGTGTLRLRALTVRDGVVLDQGGQPVPHVEVRARPSERTSSGDAIATTDSAGRFSVTLEPGIRYQIAAVSDGFAGTTMTEQENTPLVLTVSRLAPLELVLDDGERRGVYMVGHAERSRPRSFGLVRAGESFSLSVSGVSRGVLVLGDQAEWWFPMEVLPASGRLALAPSVGRSVLVRAVRARESGADPLPMSGVLLRAMPAEAETLPVPLTVRAVTDAEGYAMLRGCPGGALSVEFTAKEGSRRPGRVRVGVEASESVATVIELSRDVGARLVEAWGACQGVTGLNGLFTFSVIQTKSRVPDGRSARQLRDDGVPMVYVQGIRRTPGGYVGSFDPDFPYLYASDSTGKLHYFSGELKKENTQWRADLTLTGR